MNGRPPACVLNEQAAAFVLYALEPEQELAVRAHLPGCLSCREAAQATELVAGELAGSVEQVEPPARLRADILARATSPPGWHPPARRPRPLPVPAPRPPERAPRRRRRVVALAVAAIITVGGLAGYTANLQQQHDAEVAQSQTLAALVTQLDGPGTTHATLRTGGGEPVAAVLATATEQTVVVSGLRPNDPTASVYVVWGVSAAAPVPIGTLDVTGADPSVHPLDAAHGTQPFLGYAVSIEPGRSTPATPSTVVASGQVVA
jgi:Anti-sigma-K factor rskA